MKKLRICLAVSTQCTNVTDRQTDGWTDTARWHEDYHLSSKKIGTADSVAASSPDVPWEDISL